MSKTKAMVWFVTVGALLMCGGTLAHAQNNNQGQNRNQGQQNQQNNTFYDQKLGAQLKKVPQGYEVVSLSKKGEAAKAGLKKGDIIVDSKPMMQAMVNGKKAPPSTQLNVINGSNGKRRSVDLIGVIIGIIGDRDGNNRGGGGGGNQEYVYDASIIPVSFTSKTIHDLDGKDEFKVYMLAKMDVTGFPEAPTVGRWEISGLELNSPRPYAAAKLINITNVERPLTLYANVTARDARLGGGENTPTYGRAATNQLPSLPTKGVVQSHTETLDGGDWVLKYRVQYTPRLVNKEGSSAGGSTARSNR